MSYFVLSTLYIVFHIFHVRLNIVYLIHCIYRVSESSCLSWGDLIKKKNLGDQRTILEDYKEGVLMDLPDTYGQGIGLAALSFLTGTK